MAETREEAIAEAKAKRAEKIEKVRDKLAKENPEALPALEEILNASAEGLKKLREAAATNKVTVYNNWQDEILEKWGYSGSYGLVLSALGKVGVKKFDYIGEDFSEAKLGFHPSFGYNGGLDARYADFTGCNFENADLRGIHFNSCGVPMSWCNFRNADLSEPYYTDEEVQLAIKKGECISTTEMNCTIFSHSDFTRANLSGRDGFENKFDHCTLDFANMSNTRGLGNDYSHSTFKGTNLQGSAFDPVGFSNAIADDATNLKGIKFYEQRVSERKETRTLAQIIASYDTEFPHVELSSLPMEERMARSFQIAYQRCNQPGAGERISQTEPHEGRQ